MQRNCRHLCVPALRGCRIWSLSLPAFLRRRSFAASSSSPAMPRPRDGRLPAAGSRHVAACLTLYTGRGETALELHGRCVFGGREPTHFPGVLSRTFFGRGSGLLPSPRDVVSTAPRGLVRQAIRDVRG